MDRHHRARTSAVAHGERSQDVHCAHTGGSRARAAPTTTEEEQRHKEVKENKRNQRSRKHPRERRQACPRSLMDSLSLGSAVQTHRGDGDHEDGDRSAQNKRSPRLSWPPQNHAQTMTAAVNNETLKRPALFPTSHYLQRRQKRGDVCDVKPTTVHTAADDCLLIWLFVFMRAI